MQFIDEAEILVKAGNGGAGAVAFRREKFIPRGGPSGGDGGNGADVVLLTDERLSTLLDFRFKREYSAKNGEPGRGRDQNGHAAPELLLRVPPGTLIRDVDTGAVLADLRKNDTRYVLAQGGRGGLGNMNFATPTLQAPRFAQPGTEGEQKRVRLELRLLADLALVGLPNAGKSTLVARVSKARPKIADYPFTTLQPHLGVVQYKDQRSFVLTDLPGLIEGAHAGAGLGVRFLKHMQRCKAIIHLVDASSAPIAGRDLVDDFDAINQELLLFDRALARKPQVIAANKVDLGPAARAAAQAFAAALKQRGLDVILLSGATGEGIDTLLDRAVLALDRADSAGPLDRDLVASEGARTEEELENKADAGSEDAEKLVDERALAAAEKEKRTPLATGRTKDGTLKATLAKRSLVKAKKLLPTSDSAARLLSAADKQRNREIARATTKGKQRPAAQAKAAKQNQPALPKTRAVPGTRPLARPAKVKSAMVVHPPREKKAKALDPVSARMAKRAAQAQAKKVTQAAARVLSKAKAAKATQRQAKGGGSTANAPKKIAKRAKGLATKIKQG